jgi:ADP-ribose pyrophosphatase YjhB (NUDIX family)
MSIDLLDQEYTEIFKTRLKDLRDVHLYKPFDDESIYQAYKKLVETYWEWIDHVLKINFNRRQFVEICKMIWTSYIEPDHPRSAQQFLRLYHFCVKYEKSKPCSYGIITRLVKGKQEILLVRHEENYWSLPGGKKEGREKFEDCLARELKEEIDFDWVFSNEKFYTRKFNNKKKIVCYVISLEKRSSKNYEFTTNSPNEIKEIKWFELENLPILTKLGKLGTRYLSRWSNWRYPEKSKKETTYHDRYPDIYRTEPIHIPPPPGFYQIQYPTGLSRSDFQDHIPFTPEMAASKLLTGTWL